MDKCPKCNCEIEENSIFCHNCGYKLDNTASDYSVPAVPRNSFDLNEKSNKLLIIAGLTIIVEILAILGSIFSVRVINEDRLLLYPLLSLFLVFYSSFKLLDDGRHQDKSLIIAGIGIVLYVVSVIFIL